MTYASGENNHRQLLREFSCEEWGLGLLAMEQDGVTFTINLCCPFFDFLIKDIYCFDTNILKNKIKRGKILKCICIYTIIENLYCTLFNDKFI